MPDIKKKNRALSTKKGHWKFQHPLFHPLLKGFTTKEIFLNISWEGVTFESQKNFLSELGPVRYIWRGSFITSFILASQIYLVQEFYQKEKCFNRTSDLSPFWNDRLYLFTRKIGHLCLTIMKSNHQKKNIYIDRKNWLLWFIYNNKIKIWPTQLVPLLNVVTVIWPTAIQIYFMTFLMQQNLIQKWYKKLFDTFICFIINHDFFVIILWMRYTFFVSVVRRNS